MQLLLGKPLIQYTFEAALRAKSLDKVVVSTDDDTIAKLAGEFGLEVIVRPPELANDEATTHSALVHALTRLQAEGYYPDAVVTLQPTSPLRDHSHIDEAVEKFIRDPRADSLVSCVPVPHAFHPDSVMRVSHTGYLVSDSSTKPPTRRQDKRPVFARNGAAIYVTHSRCLPSFVFGGNILPFEMSQEVSLDIDTPYDLELARLLLAAKNGANLIGY